MVEMMTFNQLFLQLDENKLLNITNHIRNSYNLATRNNLELQNTFLFGGGGV